MNYTVCKKHLMLLSFLLRCAPVMALWFATLATTANVMAQDAPEPFKPLVVVSLAGLETGIPKLKEFFQRVDRNDVVEMMEKGIESFNGFNGIDKTRPVGMAVFLVPGLPPRPGFVFFFPVNNQQDFITTLETTRGKVVAEVEEGKYKVEYGRNFKQNLWFTHDYAWITTNAELLDTDFGSILQTATQLVATADFGVLLSVQNVPSGIREVFALALRQQANGSMQRRDEEPLSEYLARRAAGSSSIDMIEKILRDGDTGQLTISIPKSRSDIDVRVHLKALPNTGLAADFSAYPSRPSVFVPLASESEPFTAISSGALLPSQKADLTLWIDTLQARLNEKLVNEQLSREKTPAPLDDSMQGIIDSLRATASEPDLDLFVQFRRASGNRGVLLGGIRIAKAAEFAHGLRGVLTAVKTRFPEARVELNVAEHSGVSIHRIQGPAKEASEDDPAIKIFGGKPDIYVGVGEKTVWWSIGTETAAINALKSAFESISNASAQVRAMAFPFRCTARICEWLDLLPADEDDTSRKRAEEIYSPGNDFIDVSLQPTEEGLKVNLKFGEGTTLFFFKQMQVGPQRRANRRNNEPTPKDAPRKP